MSLKNHLTPHTDENAFANPASSAVEQAKTPRGLKVLGILTIVGGAGLLPVLVFIIISFSQNIANGTFAHSYLITVLLSYVQLVIQAATALIMIIFGITLLRNRHRRAGLVCGWLAGLLIALALLSICLQGLSIRLVAYAAAIIILIILQAYIDPALREERELQHKLRDMETRESAEEGTLGRDPSGKGYIQLNFFNLFWVFTVSSVLGLIIETLFHFVIFGDYQNRTGMLWGPFSPIYGFGACLMTIALNRLHNKPLILIFLVSAVIGGAFEYFTSWYMQIAFGISAWNYSGSFLSIGGRTNGLFMCMWGVLGVLWLKVFLPIMLKLINLIPWKIRYTLTSICAALMIFDGFMTVVALDCWYSRLAGDQSSSAIAEFCAVHFDNQFMANHFQSMTIDPASAARLR